MIDEIMAGAIMIAAIGERKVFGIETPLWEN